MAGNIRSIAGGKMEFTAQKIRMESTKGDIRLHSAKDTVFNAKGKITYEEYVPGGAANPNIIEGYWTDEQDNRITEALTGDKVRFHIKTRGIPVGSFVWVSLYDDDRLINAAEDDVDDKQDLVKIGTTIPFEGGHVRNAQSGGEELMLPITLTGMNKLIADEPDHMPELYCRVSYNAPNTGRRQHTSLPASTTDYLRLISLPLVIDRYKMPGLNAEATDIANDMAYGYGVKHNGPVYTEAELANYLAGYTQTGWNIERDFVFANMDLPPAAANAVMLEEVFISSAPQQREATSEQPPVPLIPQLPNKAKYTLAELLTHRSNLMKETAAMPVDALESNFRFLKSGMVWGALSPVLDEMISKFFRKEGGVFEDSRLTASIAENPSTQRYCDRLEDYIAEHLKINQGSLIGLEHRKPDYGDQEKINVLREEKIFDRTPVFTYGREWNLPAGRTLALNDIWGTEVLLNAYRKMETSSYEITYQITLWDHFGIDPPDMEKNFSLLAGFRCWFILQHLHGYKPFITKITFEKTLIGNLNKGRQERLAERATEERLRQMGRKKPGEY